MAQRKKLQVFVSSTYEDLKQERQTAVEAILTAGHIPAGMELRAKTHHFDSLPKQRLSPSAGKSRVVQNRGINGGLFKATS